MVSYPDDNGTSSTSTLPYKPSSSRAPSVASTTRSSTVRGSRQHRYSRSHAGPAAASSASSTSSRGPLNEFPTFERSGDVEIVLVSGRKEKRYILHRLYLSQCSGWFEDVLGLGDGAAGPAGTSPYTAGRRLRFELDRAKGDEMPMLTLRPTSSPSPNDHNSRPPPVRPKPPPPSNGFFRTMSNFSSIHVSSQPPPDPADDVLRTYDNLFRIFYNHAPIIDSINIAMAYTESKALLQLGATYEALPVIGPRIDHHLLRFGTRLWKQIAKYPPSYLKLGYLSRSRAIFSEALIHVVGQWPLGESALRGQVPQDVLDLIEDKVDEIDEVRQRVESKLWRLTLTTSRGERVTPGLAWLDWLVVSMWRQWFAENTTPAVSGILKDSSTSSRSSSTTRDANGRNPRTSGAIIAPAPTPINFARVFRLIAAGGQAYLSHDEVKKFMKLSPDLYSRDNMRKAERRLEEMKNLAREAVRPLTRSFLELDSGVPYLTCVRVADGEWPWFDS